jgi:hypothetical protein
MKVETKVNYSQIMIERWVKANQCLPECDIYDFIKDNPLVNGGVIQKHIRQPNSEVSHTCYLRMRSVEEAFPTKDYLSNNFNFPKSTKPQV